MNRRQARALAIALSLAATSIFAAGCSSHPRRLEHASSGSEGGSARAAKVTSREAADVQVALGRSLEDAENPAGAEAAFRKAIENDPKRADAHARLAVVMCKRGAFDEAMKEFDIALKRDPKSAEILCDRGYCLYLQRRWSEAEASLNQALARDKNHARSHNNLGLVYARKGESDRALAEFRKAGCDPGDAKANLGLILAMEGRAAESERAYVEALAEKPDSSAAREGLRMLAQAQGQAPSPSAVATAPPRRDGAVARASAAGSQGR